MPNDVRQYLKRMRWFIFDEWRAAVRNPALRPDYVWKHGLLGFNAEEKPRLRFFLVGELGEHGNRVHYHALAWWYGCTGPLDLPVGRRCFHGKLEPGFCDHVAKYVINPGEVRWDFRPGSGSDWYRSERTYWPWGFSHYKEFHPALTYYVAEYVTVDQKGIGERMRPGISRRPIIGGYQLGRMAQLYVDSGLAPQDRKYKVPRNISPPRVRGGTAVYAGKLPEYWLNRAGTRTLCREFVERWEAKFPGKPYPTSELVDEYVEWAEEERRRKAGTPTVADTLWEEGRNLRAMEQRAKFRKQPINIDWAALAGASAFECSASAGDGVKANDERLSRKALQRIADASFSEGAIMLGKAVKRYRKLKSAS